MTCSFSKELSASGITSVENTFILEYLPVASGNDVKVYLYGLFLCQNNKYDVPLEEMAKSLNLTVEEVKNSFLFWQEYDLVSVTEDPFAVIYQPLIKGYGKAKRYKPEKYTDFCAVLQQMLKNRAISPNEYQEYFNIMEIYGIKQTAMLLIVRHCIERKGDDIGYKYVSKVAKDFGARGLTTVEKVEAEISRYVSRSSELEKILKALGSTKQPDIENLKLFNKWTNELGFNYESILHSATVLKKGSFEKLDAFLMELYSLKCFTIEEIDSHMGKKKELFETSVKIAKALSLYFEVIDTVVDNYTSRWFKDGYTQDTLLFVANYCFKQGKNSLENMDKLLEFLFKNGLISFDAVSGYFLSREKDDEFIRSLLEILGLKREVTPHDRNNLVTWREWNFSDEMITEAFKKAVGKTTPVPYVNAILGNWKNKNVFTVEDIESADQPQKTNGRIGVTVEKISAKYEQYRYEANKIADENLAIAEKIKGFNDLYGEYNAIEIDIAISSFSASPEKTAQLERQRDEIKIKLENMLKTVNLTIADLKPKYKCNKCSDTGFDGMTNCSCYDSVIEDCLKDIK